MVHVYIVPRLASFFKLFEVLMRCAMRCATLMSSEYFRHKRRCIYLLHIHLVDVVSMLQFESVACDIGMYNFSRFQAELSLAVGHHESTEGGYHSMDGVSPSTQVEGLDRNKP